MYKFIFYNTIKYIKSKFLSKIFFHAYLKYFDDIHSESNIFRIVSNFNTYIIKMC